MIGGLFAACVHCEDTLFFYSIARSIFFGFHVVVYRIGGLLLLLLYIRKK